MISAGAFAMVVEEPLRKIRGRGMSPARMLAASALLPVVGACLALLFSPPVSLAQSSAAGCDDAGIAVLPSPITPWKGAPLRVIFTSEKPLDGELSLIAPDG